MERPDAADSVVNDVAASLEVMAGLRSVSRTDRFWPGSRRDFGAMVRPVPIQPAPDDEGVF